MSRTTIILASLLAVYAGTVFAGTVKTETVKMEMGEEKIFKVGNIKGVSNAGDIVEDIELEDGHSVMLRGKSWGETQVIVWDEQGNQSVFKITVNIPDYVKELEGYLDEIEGVEVKLLGKNIVATGQLMRANDEQKLKGILENFPQVKNMVKTNLLDKKEVLLSAVKAEINNPDIKFSLVGNGLMMEGDIYSEDEKRRIENIAAFYFKEIYPVLKIKKIKAAVNISIFAVDKASLEGQDASDICKFLLAASKDLSTQMPVYNLISESDHAAIARDITDQTRAASVFEKEYVIDDKGKEVIRFSDDKGERRFFIEISPTVAQKSSVSVAMNFSVEDGATNMFWRNGTFAVAGGQNIIIADIAQALRTSCDKAAIEKISVIPFMSKFISDPNKIMAILVTSTTKAVE